MYTFLQSQSIRGIELIINEILAFKGFQFLYKIICNTKLNGQIQVYVLMGGIVLGEGIEPNADGPFMCLIQES